MTHRKKLIEVALPLEAINKEAAHEQAVRSNHPSTIHIWWSRKPIAVCRAVIFASLVDDPSSHPEKFPTEEAQQKERQRLFEIIENLAKWENVTKKSVIESAKAEIFSCTHGAPPPLIDPFCGRGSIPLEGLRLGLKAFGSDLNPIAVLIAKALIEFPQQFANRPPVNPPAQRSLAQDTRSGAAGLAEDVAYYGKWIRQEAERRIGKFYPKVNLPKQYGGGTATVISWLWARTVKCPNPGCGATMPLVSKFWLSAKAGKRAWVEPVVDKNEKTVQFEVKTGDPDERLAVSIKSGSCFLNTRGKKVKATFRCLVCNSGIAKGDYISSEANEGRMGIMPMAIAVEGERNRVYLPFDATHTQLAMEQAHHLISRPPLCDKLPFEPTRGTFASNAQGRIYGFRTFSDYFSSRQLVALLTFCDLVNESRERVRKDAIDAQLGNGAQEYANAVAVYLAFILDKVADLNNTLCRWEPVAQCPRQLFGQQAISMIWEFAEANPLSSSSGSWKVVVDNVSRTLGAAFGCCSEQGIAKQLDASAGLVDVESPFICTDPPYYDNVSYSDLSDFFYVWLRRSVGSVFPELFTTILTPKSEELVATPYRFNNDEAMAKEHFLTGLSRAFSLMCDKANPEYPVSVFYAFKQTEEDEDVEEATTVQIASTGWEIMLQGLLSAGFQITGTWPMRTEVKSRQVAMDSNALASSIVLVCRPRSKEAGVGSRRDFLAALKTELPEALRQLQKGNIAPVDLAQAAIGPGMAVFSRYAKVLEADGTPMRVRTALTLINQVLDEVLAEQEGEFDANTRWAVAWFEQFSFDEGPFGVAETLSKAKNTAVGGMVEAGILAAKAGKVRLLRRDELAADWDPTRDRRITVWEVTQHLIQTLEHEGETGAAALVQKARGLGEVGRDLAYRLYGICERKKWAQEALAYNSLVIAWPEIMRVAGQSSPQVQENLF